MKYIDNYLNTLQEYYKVTIARKNINGDYIVNWTDCFELSCRELKNNKIKSSCEQNCKIAAANKAISKLASERANCTKAIDPTKCIDSLNKLIESYRIKINRSKNKQNLIKNK